MGLRADPSWHPDEDPYLELDPDLVVTLMRGLIAGCHQASAGGIVSLLDVLVLSNGVLALVWVAYEVARLCPALAD